MEPLDWLQDLDKKVFRFVLNMSAKDFTYFRYSLRGDLYDQRTKWGLGQAAFVAKILFMLDKLDEIEDFQKNNLIAFIKSFEKRDGYISDPLIYKLNSGTSIVNLLSLKKRNNAWLTQIKNAETRQAFAALFSLGSAPKKPFLHIPYSEDGVNNYLSNLDWTKPWAAGSHFSHLLFFYRINKDIFNYQPETTCRLIEYVINWVERLHSKEDGTWHQGNVPLYEKINGAMKILTGLAAINFCRISFVERLIDTMLIGSNDEHACNNFNILYPLVFAIKLTDYRRSEIEDFCLRRLAIYKKFYYERHGGFSFHKNKANDIYYGAKITKGLNEPDIHGTVMFIWGITLIYQILKIDSLNLKEPIT